MHDVLIRRQDILDALAEKSYRNEEDYRIAVRTIGEMPSVETETRGEWIKKTEYVYITVYECSNCGAQFDDVSKFCSNCGEDMTGGCDGIIRHFK